MSDVCNRYFYIHYFYRCVCGMAPDQRIVHGFVNNAPHNEKEIALFLQTKYGANYSDNIVFKHTYIFPDTESGRRSLKIFSQEMDEKLSYSEDYFVELSKRLINVTTYWLHKTEIDNLKLTKQQWLNARLTVYRCTILNMTLPEASFERGIRDDEGGATIQLLIPHDDDSGWCKRDYENACPIADKNNFFEKIKKYKLTYGMTIEKLNKKLEQLERNVE